MKRHQRHGYLALFFFLAFVLTILPLPSWAVDFRPLWVVLACFLWLSIFPNVQSFIAVLLLGGYLDLLQGSLLGLHAFALVIVVYLFSRFRSRIAFFPLMQQAGIVLLLAMIYLLLVQLCAYFLISAEINLWRFGGALLTALLWPWLALCFRLTHYDRVRSMLV